MFFKKKDTEGTVKKLDKFIMGVVIGGAIASVLGLTLRKKKKKKENEKEADQEKNK